jgi:hypothetical protein
VGVAREDASDDASLGLGDLRPEGLAADNLRRHPSLEVECLVALRSIEGLGRSDRGEGLVDLPQDRRRGAGGPGCNTGVRPDVLELVQLAHRVLQSCRALG